MISISFKKNVKFVLMSYPLLSTGLYENEFKKYPLIYVDNKDVFDKALSNESYDKLFYDQFSGVFGHATVRGNEIIAKNIINKIKKDLVE